MHRIGVIVLAAGGSSRMGAPKQFLRLQNESLISRAVRVAKSTQCGPVIVVVGQTLERYESELKEESVTVILNDEWQTGMGSSLRRGIEEVLRQDSEVSSRTEGVIILLCDQPLVTKALLEKMVQIHFKQPEKVIACYYQNSLGVPALFPRRCYPELMELHAEKGAKKIIEKHLPDVGQIDFPDGAIDLDTQREYLGFLTKPQTAR